MYRIKTQMCTKDYKIHGSHHRILDDKVALASFSDKNLYEFNSNVPVAIRHTYDKNYIPPKIITISDISSQDADSTKYNTCGHIDNIVWTTDPTLQIEGDFIPVVNEKDEKYLRSILNLISNCKDKLYFEHVVDGNLNVLFIKPYIIVELEGFYGKYKYYL